MARSRKSRRSTNILPLPPPRPELSEEHREQEDGIEDEITAAPREYIIINPSRPPSPLRECLATPSRSVVSSISPSPPPKQLQPNFQVQILSRSLFNRYHNIEAKVVGQRSGNTSATDPPAAQERGRNLQDITSSALGADTASTSLEPEGDIAAEESANRIPAAPRIYSGETQAIVQNSTESMPVQSRLVPEADMGAALSSRTLPVQSPSNQASAFTKLRHPQNLGHRFAPSQDQPVLPQQIPAAAPRPPTIPRYVRFSFSKKDLISRKMHADRDEAQATLSRDRSLTSGNRESLDHILRVPRISSTIPQETRQSDVPDTRVGVINELKGNKPLSEGAITCLQHSGPYGKPHNVRILSRIFLGNPQILDIPPEQKDNEHFFCMIQDPPRHWTLLHLRKSQPNGKVYIDHYDAQLCPERYQLIREKLKGWVSRNFLNLLPVWENKVSRPPTIIIVLPQEAYGCTRTN